MTAGPIGCAHMSQMRLRKPRETGVIIFLGRYIPHFGARLIIMTARKIASGRRAAASVARDAGRAIMRTWKRDDDCATAAVIMVTVSRLGVKNSAATHVAPVWKSIGLREMIKPESSIFQRSIFLFARLNTTSVVFTAYTLPQKRRRREERNKKEK